jgi:hypothetical protein
MVSTPKVNSSSQLSPHMIDHATIAFYRIWHGTLHLKGAGALLTRMASFSKGLQHYHLKLPEDNSIELDFRDVSAMYWLNHLLGDPLRKKACSPPRASYLSLETFSGTSALIRDCFPIRSQDQESLAKCTHSSPIPKCTNSPRRPY